MALINGIIPDLNFVAIRTAIKTTLSTELANQQVLNPVPKTAVTNIFEERRHQFDLSELPCININFGGSEYDVKTASCMRSTNTFFINVYTKAFSTLGNTDGDTESARINQRIATMVVFILCNPQYRYFPGTSIPVNSIALKSFGYTTLSVEDMQNNDNVFRTTLEFEYVTEDSFYIPDAPTVLTGGATVNLGDTDKGYFYGDEPDGFVFATELDYLFITQDGKYIVTAHVN